MILNTTLSPISRQERNKINENWQRIIAECNRLQSQINILSGDVSVEEILQALEDAIANANDTVAALEQQVQQSIADNDTATQQAIDNLNSQLQTSLNTIATKLTELETAITNAETATTDANTATSEAQEATNNALTAITNMQNFVNELSMVGLYDPTATYDKNNMVRHEKAVYIALKNGLVGVTPSDDGVNWRLVIRDGVDGTGAVSTINGVGPNENGDVQLTPSNIGAASSTDLSNLQTEVIGRLADIDKKIIGIVDAREYGAIGDGVADDSDAIQSMLNTSYTDVVLRKGVFRITKGLTSNLEGRTIRTEGATILADTQDIIVLTVTGSNNKISVNINGNNKAAVGVLVQSGGSEVSNSRIENLYGTSIGTCGVRAETSNGIVIINNVIKNINAVSNSTIGDNIGSARAILLTSMTQATDLSIIKNNVVEDILGEEGDAIQILFYDNANNSKFLKALAIIENNTIKNCNRRAIKVQGSDVDVLANTHINTLTANQLNGAFLIDVINSDNVRVIGNKLDAKLFKAMQLTGNANDIAKNLIVKDNILNCDDTFVQNGIYINTISNSEISNNTIINGSPSISIGGSKNLIIESNKFFGDNVEKIAINIISSNDNICCYSNVSYGSRLYLVQNAAPNCIIEDNHNRSISGGCIRTFATSIGSVYRNNTNNSSTTTVIGELLDQYHSGARNTGNYISGIPDIIFTADIPSTIMPNRYFSKGTISFNTNVVANGKVGWVCTTNGLGATSTWKPFGVVDA